MTNYSERLKIPLAGDRETKFTTNSGLVVATGYNRIVIGKRGPYIEFNEEHMVKDSLVVPDKELYRLQGDYNKLVYYIEYRTKEDNALLSSKSNVKVYFQTKTVDYADYVVDKYYISPFDLLADGKVIIEKLRRKS